MFSEDKAQQNSHVSTGETARPGKQVLAFPMRFFYVHALAFTQGWITA